MFLVDGVLDDGRGLQKGCIRRMVQNDIVFERLTKSK